MYVDFHCHTKNCKIGDTKRNIDKPGFIDKLSNKDVKIVAITNHNHFDMEQYKDFSINDRVQVWPGVEFDVEGITSSGHCIVIANPKNVTVFDTKVRSLIGSLPPDSVKIKLTDLVGSFIDQDVILIAHYGGKRPSLSDTDYELLKELCANKIPVYIEVQNLRSAGIMISHNKYTLIGSDVTDWSKYHEHELPELKFPIENFDRFLLAIKKDQQVIKSYVDRKQDEEITINPFDDLQLKIKIYNDLNIFIGGKGTGKTKILESIHRYYLNKGITNISSFYTHTRTDKYKEITKQVCIVEDYDILGLIDDKEEFNKIENWSETQVITTNEYFEWAKTKDSTQYLSTFGFLNARFIDLVNDSEYKIEFENYRSVNANITNLLAMDLNKYLGDSDTQILIDLLLKLKNETKLAVIRSFSRFNALYLEKRTIEIMQLAFEMNKGIQPKPSSTGLLDMFQQSVDVKNACQKIITNLSSQKRKLRNPIGDLPSKGSIYSYKEISVNPNDLNGESVFFSPNVKIRFLSSLYTRFVDLNSKSFTSHAPNIIASLNIDLLASTIESSRDLFGINVGTEKENGEKYTPSNGEQSMLVLSNALVDSNKLVYILDEPENSVGHMYINTIIVPRLKELAKLSKKVIISTHDANIAIRTLPYQTIYREDSGSDVYHTFIGSPFVDDLVDYINPEEKLNWSEISLDTLEGGKKAFIEREETYGDKRN